MDEQSSRLFPLKQEKDLRDSLLEAEEEHAVAEHVLRELSETKPKDERWKAKIMVLKENVEHHIEEEEKELFPKAKRALEKTEAEELASLFEEEKDKIRQEIKQK